MGIFVGESLPSYRKKAEDFQTGRRGSKVDRGFTSEGRSAGGG